MASWNSIWARGRKIDEDKEDYNVASTRSSPESENADRASKKARVDAVVPDLFPPMPPGTPPPFPSDLAIPQIWPPLPPGPPPSVLPPPPPVRLNPAIPPPPPPPFISPLQSAIRSPPQLQQSSEKAQPTQHVLAAAPQERDLKKELTNFVPSTLMRRQKKKEKKLVKLPSVNAAPDPDMDNEKPTTVMDASPDEGDSNSVDNTKPLNSVINTISPALTKAKPTPSSLPQTSLLLGLDYGSDSNEENSDEESESEDLASRLLKGISRPQLSVAATETVTAKSTVTAVTDDKHSPKHDDESAKQGQSSEAGRKSEADAEYEKFMNEISGLG